MKIKNWAFILFLMVLFTGCTTKVSQDESSVTNNEDVVSSENVSQGSDEATETVDNSPKLYVDMKDVFLYQVAEGGMVSEKRTTKFDSKEYKSNTAVSQKSYTYKNKALDLKYLKSSTVAKSDKTVDVYDFGGENNEWIIFEGDSRAINSASAGAITGFLGGSGIRTDAAFNGVTSLWTTKFSAAMLPAVIKTSLAFATTSFLGIGAMRSYDSLNS